MKKFLLILSIALTCITATADEPVDTSALRRRVFSAKLDELTQQLNLTAEQRRQLVSVYRDYNADMRAIWDTRRVRSCAPSSPEESAAALKHRYDRQKQALDIRIKYIDQLVTFLSAEQLWRFFEVENAIQKRINERKRKSRSDDDNNHTYYQRLLSTEQ